MGSRFPRLVAGDALRAIAALSVLAFHAAIVAAAADGRIPGDGVERIAIEGFAGLFVFFALSGYLIGRPFLRAFVMDEPAPEIRRYARSRLLRIVPAFWVAWTLLLAFHPGSWGSLGEIATVYAFGQVYDPSLMASRLMPQAWTLDVEIVFYALLPLVAWVALRLRPGGSPERRAAIAVGAIALVALASLALRASAEAGDVIVQTLPTLVWAFAPGLALAALEPVVAPRVGGSPLVRRLALACLGLSAAGFGICLLVDQAELVRQAIAVSLLAGGLLAAVVLRQWATGGTWRFLGSRVLAWIGERSYGFYLLHGLVLSGWATVGAMPGGTNVAFTLLVLATLAAALPLADLSWRLIERPAMALAHRRSDRGDRPQTLEPAPSRA